MTNKIKSLRSQYAREKAKYVAKASRSGSGLDDVIQIKWTHFKALKFLDSTINARSSKSNMEALVRFLYTVYLSSYLPLTWYFTIFAAIKGAEFIPYTLG